MVSLDYTTLRARIQPVKAKNPNIAMMLERLFFAWISALAALIFLVSMVLTAFGIVSLMQLFCIYAAITVITIALAAALFWARKGLPDR